MARQQDPSRRTRALRRNRRVADRHRYRPAVEVLERHLLLSFVVTKTSDDLDDHGNPVKGTLRWAITQANQGGGEVDFNLPGGGVQTIVPTTGLPIIDSGVTVNGYSQPGSQPNTLLVGDNAVLAVAIDAAALGPNNSALVVGGGGVTITGLILEDAPTGGSGVALLGGAFDTIAGNFIGVDSSGTSPRTNTYAGITLQDAFGNTIGGTTPGARNLISGNGGGVYLIGSGTASNVIEGNYVGVNASGLVALPNGGSGVLAFDGASRNTIGGTMSGAGNVLSANGGEGVFLVGGDVLNNVVQGNLIGVGADGAKPLGNLHSGIFVSDASGTTVGGTAAAAGNVIGANAVDGVDFAGTGITSGTVQGNYLGTNKDGATDLGNGFNGVFLGDYGDVGSPATGVTVGGTTSGAGNVISGNRADGVSIHGAGTSGMSVQGNKIGTDKDGNAALANSNSGVLITDAADNTIGGAEAVAGNVISGNSQYGVGIAGSRARGNVVQGNKIGTDRGGAAPLGNGFSGVYVGDGTDFYPSAPGSASGNTIGGTEAGAGNVISANKNHGVSINGVGASGNVVQGNEIGTDPGGAARLGNTFSGVFIALGADNTIGGAAAGAGNVISANHQSGVAIAGNGATGNVVQGNKIGTDRGGSAALGNGFSGVYVGDGSGFSPAVPGFATDNTIGGTGIGASNVISANGNGVWINGSGASGNAVQGNAIGTDVNGTAALGNAFQGVLLTAPGNTIGGTDVGASNVISANKSSGVILDSVDATGNILQGNRIGTDVTGTSALANQGDGVLIRNGAQKNVVGNDDNAPADPARNLISGNTGNGVHITDAETVLNRVAGNFIGTRLGGVGTLANGGDGALIEAGAQLNTIGNDDVGDAVATRNVISGNAGNGVHITGSDTDFNHVAGNDIGLEVGGSVVDANAKAGVLVEAGASANVIGNDDQGDAVASRNVIAGNADVQVHITGDATVNNRVAGNYVGLTADGLAPAGNGATDGVLIDDTAQTNIVGNDDHGAADLTRNVISANGKVGVHITGTGTDRNVVAGNFIGTTTDGLGPVPNAADGVLIEGGASGNIVGNDDVGQPDATRNVISGNTGPGVTITDSGTDDDVVAGNYIGLKADGVNALANTGSGVVVKNMAHHNIIGNDGRSDPVARRNVISGNTLTGVHLQDAGTDDNVVAGNDIGTDATGAVAVPNGTYGVAISKGAFNNIIGDDGVGKPDAMRNVISGNTQDGVIVTGAGSNGNRIAGNFIGTDAAGMKAVPNQQGGVLLNDQVTGTVVGTDGNAANNADERNVISGNTGAGVDVDGVKSNLVAGNFIGTTADGKSKLANTGDGALIEGGAQSDVVGDDGNGAGNDKRNVISGNGGDGVRITGDGTTMIVVAGDFVGVAADGLAPVANVGDGVVLDNVAQNTVGGAAGKGNVISANVGNGVVVTGVKATKDLIAGNSIGTDRNGVVARGNGKSGVLIDAGATNNSIGMPVAGAGNIISGNAGDGITIKAVSDLTEVVNNRIGTKLAGNAALPNGGNGVAIVDSGACFVGGPGANQTNVISGNGGDGVLIQGAKANANTVVANLIGTDVTGNFRVGNSRHGVEIDGASLTTVGAVVAAQGNVLSGNGGDGVHIAGANGANNVVVGNRIGVNAAGNGVLANLQNGVAVDGGQNNAIGQANAAPNVISGNNANGVLLTNGATGNTVVNNLIGTDQTGVVAIPNIGRGVLIQDSPSNTIGSAALAPANVISGNHADGIAIVGVASTKNSVDDNLIGLDVNGVKAVPNLGDGVLIQGAVGNFIGNAADLMPNVISGDGQAGVALTAGATTNVVANCRIGTDQAGAVAIGNAADGVLIQDSSSNTIGGAAAGAGDLISGNGGNGISIAGAASTMNQAIHDRIGTDVNGTAALGNAGDGVSIQDGSGNTVGNLGFGNVIAANALNGVFLGGASATGNTVIGEEIGIDIAGANALGNGANGVLIQGAPGNLLDIDTISGNAKDGVLISGPGASGNTVQGSILGADDTGIVAVPNGLHGVEIQGAPKNTITSDVISGNAADGVFLGGAGARGNVVSQSFIGVDNTGGTALPNGGDGVHLEAPANTVGPGNVISGNAGAGVSLAVTSTLTAGNLIKGNTIGLDSTGTAPVGNGTSGIDDDAPGNTITANVVSGNGKDGIKLVGTHAHGNIVRGNTVGLAKSGTTAIGNGLEGVEVGGPDNTIGGAAAGQGNVISGNGRRGVALTGLNTTGNVVQGNLIGTDKAGALAVGNGNAGVLVYDFASKNTIGGAAAGAGNVVSGNAQDGIFLAESTIFADVVQGNIVGLDKSGAKALGNGGFGVVVRESSSNTIGGPAQGAGNVIGANALAGIAIIGKGASGNVVQGNVVGANRAGTSAFGNRGDGVSIQGASGNLIGGAAAGQGNVIAFNAGNGVTVGTSATDAAIGDSILGNSIRNNTKLGIDLAGDGVTTNDSAGHAGPNHFQDFPVLAAAETGPGGTTILGALRGSAGTSYRVEFFTNTAPDKSGHGQGQTYLGFATVTAGATGSASISYHIGTAVPVGTVVGATATNAGGDTSEFAADVAVVSTVPAGIKVGLGGFLYNRITKHFLQFVTITNTAATPAVGPISLILDGLPAGVQLLNPTGTTTATSPAGSPYVDLNLGTSGQLPPGQSVTVLLEFVDPSLVLIGYTARVLVGPGPR
ncbi:MAG TPA: right-handed parallel beta-helix repeat-containing protein [Isosphaeraceae bacterium]|jgi:hypothetical protein|nr:right-handed parallel beta-helix repeat-containing protein [Isosphaeraceae bacterium]